jgi:hypothetical protein
VRRLFVVRESQHLESLITCVRMNWEAFANAGQPLGCMVAPYKKKRSDEQNALMWVWLTQIAEQVWTGGKRYSPETWHEHLKRELLPETCAKGVDKWAWLPSGERVLAMSTTDLNVREFTEYLERLAAYAATELGATLK